LSQGERFIVEWQYGWCGSFKTALATAMSLADEWNLRRLRIAFPSEVEAMRNFKTIKGWWAALQTGLGIRTDDDDDEETTTVRPA
jgi:hypothetical protein